MLSPAGSSHCSPWRHRAERGEPQCTQGNQVGFTRCPFRSAPCPNPVCRSLRGDVRYWGMPPLGSWLLWFWPHGFALQQLCLAVTWCVWWQRAAGCKSPYRCACDRPSGQEVCACCMPLRRGVCTGEDRASCNDQQVHAGGGGVCTGQDSTIACNTSITAAHSAETAADSQIQLFALQPRKSCWVHGTNGCTCQPAVQTNCTYTLYSRTSVQHEGRPMRSRRPGAMTKA